MNFPDWALSPTTDDELEGRRLKLAFLLRCAALAHHPSASIEKLAVDNGLHRTYFNVAIYRGRLAPRARDLISPLLSAAHRKELDEISS